MLEKIMEQNKMLIEKCAETRARREQERKDTGYDGNPFVFPKTGLEGFLIFRYEHADLSSLSQQVFLRFYEMIEKSVEDGYALQYGPITQKMAVTTDPRIGVISRENFGESAYVLSGGYLCNFEPIEGLTTEITLYCDGVHTDKAWHFYQLLTWLVEDFGIIVTEVFPPKGYATWTEVLDDPKQGKEALMKTKKEALDCSYSGDEAFFV